MKSVKMFGKKILIVFLATLLLVSTAAIAVPVSAETQTVTGETVPAYSVTMPVQFGKMPTESSRKITGIITATHDATIGVSVPDTIAGYFTGRLTELKYYVVADLKCTITAPVSDGAASYTVAPASFSLAANDVVDLTATTGAITGAWEDVVITLTITPT